MSIETADSELVPYGPDFTPATLGKIVGEDRVLAWVLECVRDAEDKSELIDRIGAEGLGHIAKPKNRRDMASHVLQALRGYKLARDTDDGERVELTEQGRYLLDATDELRPALFARHIIASCNGQRLLDEVRRFRLRGAEPTLEDLAAKLDRDATSKSISTMRAWLQAAGIFTVRYRIDEEAVARVLGADVERLLGLSREEIEFVLAARLLTLEDGKHEHRASVIADVAEARANDIRIRRKALSSFVDRLEERGIVTAGSASGKGGGGATVRLQATAEHLADDQLRQLLAQSDTGFPLNELRHLADVHASLSSGNAVERGIAGEMLAVHICLMLGLRVRSWRTRSPHAEIDLTAERASSLAYQRWVVQVKNTDPPLDADRVDRELGAISGTSVTHVLFVVPRAELTETARLELLTKSKLTPLHIFHLTSKVLANAVDASAILKDLHAQLDHLAFAKRDEALRREQR